MILRRVAITLAVLSLDSWLESSEAICKVPEDVKEWKKKSLTERAASSDIVIYGEVVYSPCWKPGYVRKTIPPTTVPILHGNNTVNATSNATVPRSNVTIPTGNVTVSTTRVQMVNATTAPTTPPYKCSSEFYNATIKVICVIKGGSVPLFILLEGLGQGDGVCLDESLHDYHAYNQLKYLIFMGRAKDMRSPRPFWINQVNHQSAVTEVNDERMLESIFEIAGRHAHLPTGGSEVTSAGMCQPYVSSAYVCSSVCTTLLLSLALVAWFLIT
ncbi:uncharacterized protein [Montipora capricornis]|uniref:uncharacterized protein n=1 Tax=Montipora foliosa TaxID=591990 RepID=UPI0035F1DC34